MYKTNVKQVQYYIQHGTLELAMLELHVTLYLQPHVQADVDFQANIWDDSTILCAHAGIQLRFTLKSSVVFRLT